MALTVITLLASRLLARPHSKRNIIERIFGVTDKGVSGLSTMYPGILKRALRWRMATLIVAVIFFIATMKLVPPLIGGELMPPMDTGIAIIEFDSSSDSANRSRRFFGRAAPVMLWGLIQRLPRPPRH